MKQVLFAAIVIALFVGLTGCAPIQAGVVPPPGMIMTDYKAPLSNSNQGITVGGKVGTAEVQQYVWIVSTGDCSVETAAKNAGITKIMYADYHYFSVLGGVYGKFTVTVHGE